MSVMCVAVSVPGECAAVKVSELVHNVVSLWGRTYTNVEFQRVREVVQSPDCQSPECKVDKSKAGHPAIKNLDPKSKHRKPAVKNSDTKSKPRPNDETMVDSDSKSESSNPVQTGHCYACILILKLDAQPSMWYCCDEPYVPYNAVDGCIMTVVYRVNPFRTPYCSVYVSSPNSTGTVAIIWMPSGH